MGLQTKKTKLGGPSFSMFIYHKGYLLHPFRPFASGIPGFQALLSETQLCLGVSARQMIQMRSLYGITLPILAV